MITTTLLVGLSLLTLILILKVTFRERAFVKGSRDNQFLNSLRSNNGYNRFYGYWIIK